MRKEIFLSTVFCVLGIASAYSLQYHPFLLKTKDNKGITLAKTLDGVYGEKISVKDGRCKFFEMQQKGGDIEYELDRKRELVRVEIFGVVTGLEMVFPHRNRILQKEW